MSDERGVDGAAGPGAARSGGSVAPLGPREFGRWVWRQLTSMRTALLLLFLLALAAIPGSVVPQRAVDAQRLARWQEQHTTLTPIYERLDLFDVYGSVWFSAIYLLLIISLIGCILPRIAVYARALRARPPRAPRRFERLPEHRVVETDESLEVVADRIRAGLRRYRVDRHDDRAEQSGVVEFAAERGYLREAGNIAFHLALLVVLVGFAGGSLLGYRGGVIVVENGTFANSLSQYDEFEPGGFFSTDSLDAFSFTVTDFDVTFITQGKDAGLAHEFSAGLDYRTVDGAQEHTRIAVNHPLGIGGTRIYLIGHGYAPHITVRDAAGEVVTSGPVVFLPEDPTFRSFGVVKVPDAPRDQLGFEGEFYPTYAFIKGDGGGPLSAFPDAMNPAISMLAYRGDLGMDDGVPQSVYALQKEGLEPILDQDGKPLRVDLMMGQTMTLPDRLGTISLDGVSRFVKLQVNRSPGDYIALGGVIAALVGLLGSLFIRPRRVWVRLRRDETTGRTLVEVAGLDRSQGGDLATELEALVALTGRKGSP